MNILNVSAISSLIIQLITGLIEITGLAFDVKPTDEIVKDILRAELFVQIIEFIFYCYLVYKIITGFVSTNITSHRYIDWSITTPIMLVNFIIFFKYLANPERKIGYFDSIKEEIDKIIYILIANFGMLGFGYIGEIGLMNVGVSTAIGFIPYAYIFKQIYSNYIENIHMREEENDKKKKNIAVILFYITFILWGLYGVSAVLPFKIKNTFYNILDLFSKNAFGFFLYFFIRSIQQ
jgi:bacteriorhodopsin